MNTIKRSGTKGMKWYHRYHQSYSTKPTRSGKVGEEYISKEFKNEIKRASNKDGEWEKHSYIDKIKTKAGKWRYIYKDDLKGKVNNAQTKINNSINNIKKPVTNNPSKAQVNPQTKTNNPSKAPIDAKQIRQSIVSKLKDTIKNTSNNKINNIKINKSTQNKIEEKYGATFTLGENGETVTNDSNAKKVPPRKLNNVRKIRDEEFNPKEVSSEYLKELEFNTTGKNSNSNKSNNLPDTPDPSKMSKEWRQEMGLEEAPKQNNTAKTPEPRKTKGATFTYDKESGSTKKVDNTPNKNSTTKRDTSSSKGIKGLVENFSNGLKKFLEGNSLPAKVVKAIMPDDIDNAIRAKLGVKDPGINDFSEDAKDTFQENRNLHTELKQKTEVTSRDEDMLAINPKLDPKAFDIVERTNNEYFDAIERGDKEAANKAYKEQLDVYIKNGSYMQNCVNCSFTYDLRRRGYDVEAPKNKQGTSLDTATDFYKLKSNDIKYTSSKNGDSFSEKEQQDFSKYMNDTYPEGAYGHLMVKYTMGGGHDVIWSKENDKIVVRDCQSGKVLELNEVLEKSNDVTYFRADDKEISELGYDYGKAKDVNKYEKSAKYKYDKIHNALSKKK